MSDRSDKAQSTVFKPALLQRKTKLTLLSMLALLGIWTALVPMQSAVITSGFVRAENANKPIQHLQGGKLSKVFVKPGDQVAVGTTLAQLSVDQEKSALRALLSDYLTLRTQLNLAESELANAAKPVFDNATLVMARRLDKMTPLKLAASAYVEKRNAATNKLELIAKREEQLHAGHASSLAQREATLEQIGIIETQLAGLNSLAAEQMVARVKVDALKQQLIGLNATADAHQVQAADRSNELEQLALERTLFIADLRQSANQKRADATAKLPNIEGKIERLKLKVASATITSDYAGTVTNVRHRSAGGTIAAGEPLMEIVPSDESLIIEARLRTEDVEQVYPGQPSRIRLSAFNTRSTALIDGQVTGVSADRHQDADGFFYQVELTLNEDIAAKHPEIYLATGMPVEVFLITKERSVMEYLWAPLARGLNRSLRES